jgi:hypothetical protein
LAEEKMRISEYVSCEHLSLDLFDFPIRRPDYWREEVIDLGRMSRWEWLELDLQVPDDNMEIFERLMAKKSGYVRMRSFDRMVDPFCEFLVKSNSTFLTGQLRSLVYEYQCRKLIKSVSFWKKELEAESWKRLKRGDKGEILSGKSFIEIIEWMFSNRQKAFLENGEYPNFDGLRRFEWKDEDEEEEYENSMEEWRNNYLSNRGSMKMRLKRFNIDANSSIEDVLCALEFLCQIDAPFWIPEFVRGFARVRGKKREMLQIAAGDAKSNLRMCQRIFMGKGEDLEDWIGKRKWDWIHLYNGNYKVFEKTMSRLLKEALFFLLTYYVRLYWVRFMNRVCWEPCDYVNVLRIPDESVLYQGKHVFTFVQIVHALSGLECIHDEEAVIRLIHQNMATDNGHFGFLKK